MPGGSIATTLALFVVVYGIVFAMGIYYINRLIAKGRRAASVEPSDVGSPSPAAVAAADAAPRSACAHGAQERSGERPWNGICR